MHQLPAFNGVVFRTIERDGDPWITAADLARALGYSRDNAVTQIYHRNVDEFTPSMTAVELLRWGAEPQSEAQGEGADGHIDRQGYTETRIFSLRGAQMVAMKASTPIAKQFRIWVLDVLEAWDALMRMPPSTTPLPEFDEAALLNAKVAWVRLLLRLRGKAAALDVAGQMGLPMPLAAAPARPEDDAALAEAVRLYLAGRTEVRDVAEVMQAVGSGSRLRVAELMRLFGWHNPNRRRERGRQSKRWEPLHSGGEA